MVEDGSFLYWDARPSSHVKTLEFRVADVCMTIDEAVLVAGLTRALARACHDEWSRGQPVEPVRPELLRAATWRASRFGLEGDLIDVRARRSVPARELVEEFLRYLRPWLEQDGDWDEVRDLVRRSRSPRHRRAPSARGPLPGRPDGGRGRPDPGGDGAGGGVIDLLPLAWEKVARSGRMRVPGAEPLPDRLHRPLGTPPGHFSLTPAQLRGDDACPGLDGDSRFRSQFRAAAGRGAPCNTGSTFLLGSLPFAFDPACCRLGC